MDDVGTFHRFARVYDLAMPRADPDTLSAALGYAERDVERVVDLAGGTGRGLEALDMERGDRFEGGADLGVVVDAARGMLGRARAHGHAVVQADAGRLPLADASVDAVLVLDALHHLPDRVGAIDEAARALAPGGVLVIQEFDPTTLRGRALVATEHLVGFDSAFDPPAVLCTRLQRAGLEPVVVARGFSYVVVGVKPPTGVATVVPDGLAERSPR